MTVPRAILFTLAAFATAAALALAQTGGLAAIEAEPKLEKRARDALAHARKSVSLVVKAYHGGDVKRGQELLAEIQRAVEMAKEALDATGKDPSRNPKEFKHAEISTRRLLGELQEIERELNYDERDKLLAVEQRVSEINQELLLGIMTKKKKK
jgi:hypothetical protein